MEEENKSLLIYLLEKILGLKIDDIEYLNLEPNVSNVNIRRRHLDLILKTNIGYVQVEVNTNGKDKFLRRRNYIYAHSVYMNQVPRGRDGFTSFAKVYQINFYYGVKNKRPYRKFMIWDEEHEENLIDDLIIYEFYMENYKEIWYNGSKEEIDNNTHLIMLDLELEELKKLTTISSEEGKVKLYMERLEQVNGNPLFMEFMSAEKDNELIERSIRVEEFNKGVECGIERGIEQGSINEKLSIAKSMLEENIDIELISKVTGLSIDEIKNISNN